MVYGVVHKNSYTYAVVKAKGPHINPNGEFVYEIVCDDQPHKVLLTMLAMTEEKE